MAIDLSIADLFAKAFGIRADAFDPKFNQVIGDNVRHRTDQGKAAGSPYYVDDVLGREVYMPVQVDVGGEVIPGTQTTYAEALGVQDESGNFTGKWYLPYPVISLDMNYHYVDTELTERNGMVSELINIGGYKIFIKGLLINQKANEFPEDDYTTMCRLAALKNPFKINNPMTDIALLSLDPTGEKLVTIRNLRWPERLAVKNVRPYELELWSEIPFNLVDVS